MYDPDFVCARDFHNPDDIGREEAIRIISKTIYEGAGLPPAALALRIVLALDLQRISEPGELAYSQKLAALDVSRTLWTALGHIELNNYGLAREKLLEALERLPVDTGEGGIVWDVNSDG
jgi:hypothetical protein